MKYEKAIEIRIRLVPEHPAVPDYRDALAGSQHNTGILFDEMGKLPDAAASFKKAIEARSQLAAMHPDVVAYESRLASDHNSLGVVLVRFRRFDEAEEEHKKAVSIQRRLAAQNQDATSLTRDLATFLHGMGAAIDYAGKPEESLGVFEKEASILQELIKRTSAPRDRNQLASCYISQSVLLSKSRRQEKAIALLQRALAIRRQLAHDSPQNLKYKRGVAGILHRLGHIRHQRRELDAALECYLESIDITRPLAKGDAAWVDVHVDLGGSCCNAGIVSAQLGRIETAHKLFDEAIEVLEGAVQRAPNHPQSRQFLFNSRQSKAGTLDRQSRHEEAIPHWRRALELSDSHPLIRTFLARSLAQSGEHEEAVRIMESINASEQSITANVSYQCACVYSVASAKVLKDESLSPEKRKAASDDYAEQASQWLLKAKQAGFFKSPENVKKLKTDRDLAPLRHRSFFKSLSSKLETADTNQ